MTPPVALTIAGSDSSGGAGVQADLRTFAALGVFGTTAITALTAQNTVGVQGVHVVPAAFVDEQIQSVISDLDVHAVKTGMLATQEIIETVARRAAAGDLPNLVVDPVMVASSGDRLLDPAAEESYLQSLFPQALVVTPNLREAAVLVGRDLHTSEDMELAAREIHAAGTHVVVIKGGHRPGKDAADVVWDGERITWLRRPWVATENNHGTGCSFASATAAGLALGKSADEAIRDAKDFVTRAVAGGAKWRLGAGHGPLDHFGWDRTAAHD